MNKVLNFSFLSQAERLTHKTLKLSESKDDPESNSHGEIISRFAAVTLSPAAALDIAFHTLLILPTFIYAIGKSIWQMDPDFTLPWQQIQRVRNAVAPLLLGSFVGIILPEGGLEICETTDKHAVIGMLSSNIEDKYSSSCSPIHSLSIVEDLAKAHQYANEKQKTDSSSDTKSLTKKEIFSKAHLDVISSANSFEKSLESLHGQEFFSRICNLSNILMKIIEDAIKDSQLSTNSKEILNRVSKLLIPVLAAVDLTIALIVQAILLVCGVARLISGRGPTYTEVTTDPLTHVNILIHNILKFVGNIIGGLISIGSPSLGSRVMPLGSMLFFHFQIHILMQQIKLKMWLMKDQEQFAIPIVNLESDSSGLPCDNMHMTYLIVEKSGNTYNLYWVNRPTVKRKIQLDSKTTLEQIGSMLKERFPFMDAEKLNKGPVKAKNPDFADAETFMTIAVQGNTSNCVVSNIFGMLEVMDKIQGADESIGKLRNKVVRDALKKDYEFYENDFFSAAGKTGDYSLNRIWSQINGLIDECI